MASIINEQIDSFKKANGIEKIIAFSGGGDDYFETSQDFVKNAVEALSQYPIAILSGGTSFGIPKLATTYAKAFNLPTIGVIPFKGEKYSLQDLDLKLVIDPRFSNSEWGDESEVFSKLPDGAIFYGGMFGTLIEYAHIMKINQERLKKQQKPIYVAIATGTGSIIDNIYALSQQSAQSCFPDTRIITGGDAAKFIINKLFKAEDKNGNRKNY